MIKKIAFTMYSVNDLTRARQFYEQDLGLKMTQEFNGQWIEYDLAGGCFAITSMLKDQVKPSANSGGSIAFEVDDVDTLVAQLKEKGHTILREPFSSPVCRMAVVMDTEGNAVMLHKLNRST